MFPLQRRQVIASTVGIVITTGLSGCGYQNTTPVRMLTFREVRTEETKSGWRVSFAAINKNEASEELGTFHNVRVHGYDRDRNEVCSKAIGTVSSNRHTENAINVEMTCSAFPTMLTYSATESPCDDEVRTVIHIAVYEDGDGWSLERSARECNEGLPPNP